MSAMKAVKLQLFKVKCSRLVRGTFRSIKRKFSDGTADSVDGIFNEDIRPTHQVDREKKAKSTAIVLAAGTAIGISHAAAGSTKYGVPLTPKSMIAIGGTVGATLGYVWYNYVDAAKEDVTEDQINDVIEIVSSTSMQTGAKYSDDGLKAVDIIHTIVTGRDAEFSQEKSEDGRTGKLKFEYLDKDEDEDSKDSGKEDKESSNAFISKSSFSDKVDKDDDSNDDDDGRTNIFKRGTIGKGKGLLRQGGGRKSFIPAMDQDSEVGDAWLDFET